MPLLLILELNLLRFYEKALYRNLLLHYIVVRDYNNIFLDPKIDFMFFQNALIINFRDVEK